MQLPTFLVIGAQKCGTSWLAQMLRQHPEIFVPETKELHFFNKKPRFDRGLSFYADFFANAGAELARGEFTPNYFWTTPDATECAAGGAENAQLPERVATHIPDAKLIVILRDPVQRAVSAYFHHVRKRRIHYDETIGRAGDRYGIQSMGFYDVHLERWQAHFPKSQWLVLFYEEDIAKNKERTLSRVCEFLGVNPEFRPDNIEKRVNRRRSPLHMRLNFRAPWLADALDVVLPKKLSHAERFRLEVSPEDRALLAELYKPHDARLADLLGRPLPW